MLTGAHMVIFSSNVEADRAFFGEVLKLPSADKLGVYEPRHARPKWK